MTHENPKGKSELNRTRHKTNLKVKHNMEENTENVETTTTENIQPEAIEVPIQEGTPETGAEAPKIQMPESLNPNQALQVLVDAARMAQQRGVFSLEDAELVSKAVKVFTTAQPGQPAPGPSPAS